jgi:16S rRNA (cytosine967-C5)-methyltransferase
MRHQSYLNTTIRIIESYKGEEPLSSYLKKYFSANKKYGSTDRRQIAALCYGYFRLGKAVSENTEADILTGVFLSEQFYNDVVANIKPEWAAEITKPVAEKIKFLQFPVKQIFPLKGELTAAVHHEKFCESFLKQPKLFLRIRPNKKNILVQKLQKAKIPLSIIDEESIALSNATKLDDIIDADREAVIQDYNSQQVFNFLKIFAVGKKPVTAWDCCAASGGKSILLYDVLKKNIELTVSDIRLSILLNLHQRFIKAGIKNYNYFIADLNTPSFSFPALTAKGTRQEVESNQYELIICDAPCTGSGTWSRTPENLFYFKTEQIEEYAEKQKQIASNVIPYLQAEGLFFYITCSVFKKENEDVANYLKEKFQLQLLHMELLKGYDKKADCMFVAVFKK